MRVLLTLASSSVTGPAERMLGDAEVLRAAGHEVTLAFDTRRPGNLAEACAARGLPVAGELRLSRHSGPLEMLRDLRALRRRLRTVDLVHTHFSHDHHLALLAALGLSNRPRVVRSLESAATGARPAIARSDGIEVPSLALLAQPRLAGIRAIVEAIPNAVDPERFSPAPSTALRDELGIPRDAPLAGIVSRVKPERHHLELVDAFREVVDAVPAARLVIVGRGDLGPVQARVAALGLADVVHFAGYWAGPRLVEAYRSLDVAAWLAPGNDGGARGVLEAMAVGLPVVAYEMPPMAEQLGASVTSGAGTVSGATRVGTVSGATRGSTVVGATRGSTVVGATRGSTVVGATRGSTVVGAARGSTVSGAARVGTVVGAARGSTVVGAARGSTVSGATRVGTVSGATRGSTVSGATEAIPVFCNMEPEAGVLVPDRDVAALARGLVDLLRDPGRRLALGGRARERVLRQYTWAVRGPKLLAFYASVLRA